VHVDADEVGRLRLNEVRPETALTLEDHMNVLSLVFFQYFSSGTGTQYGSWPMLGILIGIVAGMIAAVAGRSGSLWGALVGSICFAAAWAVNKPEGADLGRLGHITAPLLLQIAHGAVSGAVWCGLWGLFGGWICRKMRATKSVQQPRIAQLLGTASAGTPNRIVGPTSKFSAEGKQPSERGTRGQTERGGFKL